jgi:hypothetical protein
MTVHFLSEDKEKAYAFGAFLAKHARWELTTQESCDLTKHLAWYNTLPGKIESHIFEIQKSYQAPDSKKAK